MNQERRLSVLLVDDDEHVREALARDLTVKGHDVVEAVGGSSALAMLRAHHVDVVVSDHDMPGMNGLNLLQLVRMSYPRVLRILLTGRGTMDLAVKALNEHTVHRFLLKPWQRQDLEGIMQIAMRSRETEGAA